MTTQTTMKPIAGVPGAGIDRQPVGGAPRGFPAQAQRSSPSETGSLLVGSAVYTGRWLISRHYR